jgi:hypothetical protein
LCKLPVLLAKVQKVLWFADFDSDEAMNERVILLKFFHSDEAINERVIFF